jgi:hypothetical protein
MIGMQAALSQNKPRCLLLLWHNLSFMDGPFVWVFQRSRNAPAAWFRTSSQNSSESQLTKNWRLKNIGIEEETLRVAAIKYLTIWRFYLKNSSTVGLYGERALQHKLNRKKFELNI